MRGWQIALLNAILTEKPDGKLLYRSGLIGIARKNGKSSFASALALFGLVFGKPGSEIYSCAGDKDQARIVFGMAKAMVEIDPELKDLIHVYRDTLEVVQTGSIYRALSAEAYTKEGLNPSLVLFDEVHVQPDDELWNVMELAAGARPEPLMLGITTAGVRTDRLGMESLCYGMYKNGIQIAKGLVVDPTFFFAWWEPIAGAEADHRDPKVWAEANPGLGDVVSIEDFHSTLTRVPEPDFRTKRTNVFVSSMESWLPFGAWAKCELSQGPNGETPVIRPGESVILGFDGSYNNDSTAIVAATVGKTPFVQTVRVWERQDTDPPDWVVPIEDVENELRLSCRKWRVTEIECDPARWAKSLQTLAREGLPIVEYPQSPERMIPATQRFYEAVMNHKVTHGSDPILARHLDNAVLKVTERGSRIVKETQGSQAKIDAAVAVVMAYDRAAGPPTVAAGWLGYMRGEVAKDAVAPADLGLEIRDHTITKAPSRALTPKDILLGVGRDMPTRQNQCQHRWHPLDHICVFCTIPKEEYERSRHLRP